MSRRARLRFAAVLAAFVIGAATPCMEIYRGIYHAVTEKTIRLAQDGIGMIDDLARDEGKSADDYLAQLVAEFEAGGEDIDADDAAEVEALVPAAVGKLGKLDILVNNAGITRDGLAMRMKDEDWAAVIRVDLEAAFRLSRAALRPMMKARHGRIVSISSVVGSINDDICQNNASTPFSFRRRYAFG